MLLNNYNINKNKKYKYRFKESNMPGPLYLTSYIYKKKC